MLWFRSCSDRAFLSSIPPSTGAIHILRVKTLSTLYHVTSLGIMFHHSYSYTFKIRFVIALKTRRSWIFTSVCWSWLAKSQNFIHANIYPHNQIQNRPIWQHCIWFPSWCTYKFSSPFHIYHNNLNLFYLCSFNKLYISCFINIYYECLN